MSHKIVGVLVPSIVGVVAAIGIGLITIPLVAIFLGAAVAFWLTRKYGTQKYYAAVGTLFYILLGILVLILPFMPAAFKQSPMVFLLIFGVLSAKVVVIRRLVGFVLSVIADRIGRRGGESSFWNAISSIVGTIYLAWILVKMKYRLAKTGVAGVATPAGLLLNALGHFFELPWILEVGLNITTMIFVGGLIIIFHVLTSWYELIALRNNPLVEALAEKSKDAGSKTLSQSQSIVDSAEYRVNTVHKDEFIGGQLISKILGI